MDKSTNELLKLINEGKNVNEISEITKLSNKVIFGRINMLRNAGYNFKKLYYSDGNIVYSNGSDMIRYDEKYNGTNLIVDGKNGKQIDAIAISDIHFGSAYEIEGIMDKIYNYCINNDIHIILFGGDLVDGTFGKWRRINNIDEQLTYIMQKYPFDKSIINFGVLGNHDYSIFKANSRDISLILNNYRHDIVPLGYFIGKLNIGNDTLTFLHGSKRNYLSYKNCNIIPYITSNNMDRKSIVLRGHTHKMFTITEDDFHVCINLPSISGMRDKDEFLPSAIRIRISLNNDTFSHIIINQLLIKKKIHSINEFKQSFTSCKKQDYCDSLEKINYNEFTELSDFMDVDDDEIDFEKQANPKTLIKKL